MLREKLRKEKIKNRVMERNVKAEAVALARRILADEKRRKAALCEKKKSGEAKSALLLHEEEREKEKRMNKENTKTRIDFEKRYNERTEEMNRRKEGRRSVAYISDVKSESDKNKKPEWNDSFATERFERFPDAPIRNPVTIEELRRREKEKRREALHKPFSSSSLHFFSNNINARKSRSSTSSSSSLTSVVSSRRIFG